MQQIEAPDSHGQMSRTSIAVLVVLMLLAVTSGVIAGRAGQEDISIWRLFHLALEAFAACITLAIVLLSTAHSKERSHADAVLAKGYFFVCLLNFVHSFTSFDVAVFGLGDVGTQALLHGFGLLSRLVASITLLLMVWYNHPHKTPPSAPTGLMPVLAFLTVAWVLLTQPELHPALHNDAAAQLLAKQLLVWLVLPMDLLAGCWVLFQLSSKSPSNIKLFAAAIWVAALADFLLFLSPRYPDWGAIYGHLCKTLSYCLLLHSAFLRLVQEPRRQLQARAEEARTSMLLAIDGSGQGVFDISDTGRVFFSSRWKTMLGLPPDAPISAVSDWEERLHPDDKESTLAYFRNFYCQRETDLYESEHRLRHEAGHYIWVLSRGRVIARDAKGNILRLIGMHTDITHFKEKESAREKSENRYRALVDLAMPDALYVHDHTGCLRDVNRQACLSSGYSRDDLLGMSLLSVVPPEFIGEAVAQWRVLAPGERCVLFTEFTRADGSRFPVEMHTGVFLEGDERIYVSLVHSLVLRKRNEQLLAEREAAIRETSNRLRAITDSLDVSLALLNEEGQIVQVNRAWEEFALNNKGSAALSYGVGLNYLEVCVHAAEQGDYTAKQALAGIQSVRSGERDMFKMDYPAHSPTEKRWFQLTVAPMLDNRRKVLIQHTDITRLKEIDFAVVNYRRILDTIAEPIVVLDAELCCIANNFPFADEFGLHPSAMLGKSLREMVSEEGATEVGAALHRVLAGACESVHVRLLHAPARYYIARCYPYRTAPGEIVGAVCVLCDDSTHNERVWLQQLADLEGLTP